MDVPVCKQDALRPVSDENSELAQYEFRWRIFTSVLAVAAYADRMDRIRIWKYRLLHDHQFLNLRKHRHISCHQLTRLRVSGSGSWSDRWDLSEQCAFRRSHRVQFFIHSGVYSRKCEQYVG